MKGIYFMLPALFAIFVSFLIVRAGAIALMMTGMDRKRAIFQSLSAFTGTGFTTKEAERVTNNPLRRKIISVLMILGNAGIVAIIITATSSLVTSSGYTLPIHFFVFFVGIYFIYRIGRSREFVQKWEMFIEKRLLKIPAFEEGALEDLLHLLEGYGLVRKKIKKGSSLANKTLSGCKICREDILVLGIERGKGWMPIPKHNEKIQEGDTLVVYGDLKTLREMFAED